MSLQPDDFLMRPNELYQVGKQLTRQLESEFIDEALSEQARLEPPLRLLDSV